MAVDWRDTLRILLPQFEARATSSPGLNHILVESADSERDKLVGPKWLKVDHPNLQIVDGKPQYATWDMSSFSFMPAIGPSYRKPNPNETFESTDRVVRDQCDVVHAVFEPMRLRSGYLCGKPSEEGNAFQTLATAVVNALKGATDFQNHFLSADLLDFVKKPAHGIRYVFGQIDDELPDTFVANGWQPGALAYEHGVLIDLPLASEKIDYNSWLLLLHRLGWKKIRGSGLRASRFAWGGNVEVEWETLTRDHSHLPPAFLKQFDGVSRNSFYSVLGTKENPIDVNLASVFAIQLLLSDMTSTSASSPSNPEAGKVDYSNEAWFTRNLPEIKPISKDECKSTIAPRIGLFVATDAERQATLKRMRPPKGRKSVFQVFVGSNTYYVGRFGVIDAVLCMTAMGSSGRDSSTMVASEFIDEWQLLAVVMVGIAFGKDAEKQAIGNVLISDRVIQYEAQRVSGENSIDRGNEPLAGTTLLNRFRNVIGWRFTCPNGDECGMQVGAILSGEKLVDDLEFKTELFKRYPTAIGGEMEGAGLASAADRKKKCEWIVVKAICDWADGTKTKEHQEFAAASAVSLVEHVFNQVGALDAIQ